jgi:hypothetical protein
MVIPPSENVEPSIATEGGQNAVRTWGKRGG